MGLTFNWLLFGTGLGLVSAETWSRKDELHSICLDDSKCDFKASCLIFILYFVIKI
jgi:hypothetical protein